MTTTTNNDLEDLDALWASFHLPVPIAAPRGGGNTHSSSSYSFANKNDEWMLEFIDLLRLLYTMDRQYANKNRDCFTSSKKIMASQISLAYSTLSRVERTCPYSQENILLTDEVSGDHTILQQNIFILLQKARNYTDETCVKFQRWLERPMPHPAQKKYQKKQGSPEERDLIYDIFLSPASTSTSITNSEDDDTETLDEINKDEYDDDFDETATGIDINKQLNFQNQRQQSTQSSSSRLPPPKEMDPIEFQKQQQELLEEELASMASRLKSSTLTMNATLQTQTKELDNMEQLAQTNLDQVTDTTKKVEARLARTRGWKKNLATWSLIGTVIGVWILCFMVMRIAPKRKIGKVNLLDNLRHGRNRVKDTWTRYFSKDDDDEMSRDDEAHWQEEQYPEERYTDKHRQQEQQSTQNECEVHTDGTQTCYDWVDVVSRGKEKLAQDIVAERKRRRIVENMANAIVVDALEPDSAKGTTHYADEMQRKKIEAAHLEEERLLADTHRKVQEKLAEEAQLEAQRLEEERQAQEARLEAERLEQERLRAEAEMQAEDERVRQDKLAEEAQLEAYRLEKDRLREEASKKAESERLDRERLAIEAANQADEAKDRIPLEAEAGAKEAIENAKQYAASDYTYFSSSDVRSAAGRLNGNDLLAYCILMAPEMIEDSDKIGWRPLHEAARAGNIIGIQLLINSGVELTSRTGRKENGGTALWWAIQRFGEDHSAVQLLRYHGAPEQGPEL